MKRVLWLMPLLLSAADAPKPKPLTAEQRAEALAAAVATQQAEIAVHRLEAQYRTMREKLVAAHEEAARKEDETTKKLRATSDAEGCNLTAKAEWQCKPQPDSDHRQERKGK